MVPPGIAEYRVKELYADELWRRLIYAKEPSGICPVCRRANHGQAMHLFPRKNYKHLRHDLENGAPGCQGCHHRLGNDHEAHRDFCIRYLGAERYGALRLRSIARGKADIDLVILDLEGKILQAIKDGFVLWWKGAPA